ncbi:MAG: type II secretion system minor pseudopilin GspI [Pseudomonadales bacterium]|nr:type II secretion system minor pseudopilin GspI [Pseudomonadales bacterium]
MNNAAPLKSGVTRPHKKPMRFRNRGFTLIEVLVALAVAGIALTAILKAVNAQLVSAQVMEEKTVAHWVALNVATEIRLTPTWSSIGSKKGDTEMLDQQWNWQALTSGTPDPDLRRIDITVYNQADKEQGGITIFTGRNR